jgi:eukaryotic-like serine/threonine-protein kinase
VPVSKPDLKAEGVGAQPPPEVTGTGETMGPSADWPSGTISAPPFRPPAEPDSSAPETGAFELTPGECLDDFEVLGTLGRGGFATVYLARQRSLDRQVALKVSSDRGDEARTLAGLEHDHIVRVFSESRHHARNLRLLCMQLVPGATLGQVIRALAGVPRAEWSGQSILEQIDALATLPASFDPAALRDRELLACADYVEAACWLGARVADALAHAHGRGVLHRDLKPANILLNRYGRPLLADFNVAQRENGRPGGLFGGTLAYMAPEHLDAFNPRTGTPPDAVDERSDVYSLGVVLFELLTGRRPFGPGAHSPNGHGREEDRAEALSAMADERCAGPPPLPEDHIPGVLRRTIIRCLAPRPGERYPGAAEVAEALDGYRRLHRMQKGLPVGGWLTLVCLRYPFAALAVLVLLPQVLGSAVNISYNTLRIVNHLTPEQQDLFTRLVLGYNAMVYPACLLALCWLTAPVLRAWRRLAGGAGSHAAVDDARRRVLRWPLLAVGLSCAGWLPGGLLFPALLHALAGPLPTAVFGHFLLSFTISGLIATTYSLFAIQFVALRSLYPRLWVDARGVSERAVAELRPLGRRLGFFQMSAGLIPLAGAVLLIEVGPGELDGAGTRSFRVLLTALIVLGMFGFGVALAVSRRLNDTLAVLTGRGR